MLAQSRSPLLTASDFRLLAANTQPWTWNFKFCRWARPGRRCTVVSVSGSRQRGLQLGKFKFFSSQWRCGIIPTLRLKLDSLLVLRRVFDWNRSRTVVACRGRGRRSSWYRRLARHCPATLRLPCWVVLRLSDKLVGCNSDVSCSTQACQWPWQWSYWGCHGTKLCLDVMEMYWICVMHVFLMA